MNALRDFSLCMLMVFVSMSCRAEQFGVWTTGAVCGYIGNTTLRVYVCTNAMKPETLPDCIDKRGGGTMNSAACYLGAVSMDNIFCMPEDNSANGNPCTVCPKGGQSCSDWSPNLSLPNNSLFRTCSSTGNIIGVTANYWCSFTRNNVTKEGCREGDYNWAASVGGPVVCRECPDHATCGGLGNTDTFTCDAGYYQESGEQCSLCTSKTQVDAATSGTGATSITNCYVPANSKLSDESGTYTFEQDCYYSL